MHLCLGFIGHYGVKTSTSGAAYGALAGKCPACDQGSLFSGFLKLADFCAKCGADFRELDPGDGPAVFAILIVGAVGLLAALALEFSVHPPLWVHAIVLGPFILFFALGLLRLIKSILASVQFRNDAREGRRIPLSN